MHIHTQIHIPQAHIKAHTCTEIGCERKVLSASTQVSFLVCECHTSMGVPMPGLPYMLKCLHLIYSCAFLIIRHMLASFTPEINVNNRK